MDQTGSFGNPSSRDFSRGSISFSPFFFLPLLIVTRSRDRGARRLFLSSWFSSTNQKPLIIDKRAFFFFFFFYFIFFLIDVSENAELFRAESFSRVMIKMQRYPGYRRFDGNNRAIVVGSSVHLFRKIARNFPDRTAKLISGSARWTCSFPAESFRRRGGDGGGKLSMGSL